MTAKPKSGKSTADREIVITRVVNARRERVFEAWSDPERLKHWWGPDGFTDTTHKFEFKKGGAWVHTMRGPDGVDYHNKMVYKEISAPERLVYVITGKDKEEHGVKFEGTVTFKDLGERTEITMRSVFSTAAERDRVVKASNAVEGGKQTLGRLSDYLDANKPAFELILSRVVDAPRERVFAVWTKPEHVSRWFAPQPLTLPKCEMDFRPGGSFSMAMRMPDGQEHPFTGVYGEIDPPSKLTWTGEFPGGPEKQIQTTVFFEALGAKTKVTVRQIFTVLTPATEPATKGAKMGWTATLNQMAAYAVEVSLL